MLSVMRCMAQQSPGPPARLVEYDQQHAQAKRNFDRDRSSQPERDR